MKSAFLRKLQGWPETAATGPARRQAVTKQKSLMKDP
jgi:hypothetical protein